MKSGSKKRLSLWLSAMGLAALVALALPVCTQADTPSTQPYPQPSPYPISWELTVKFSQPKRIVVQSPGQDTPVAYWFLTYHVANNSERDTVLFYPKFDMLMEDGKLVQSDFGIPPSVYAKIKDQEHNSNLQNINDIAGELHQGNDSARDGVTVWREPDPRMGTITVFASGFWGESATVKIDGKDVILHKTLQTTYHLNSDELHPGQGDLVQVDKSYVMR